MDKHDGNQNAAGTEGHGHHKASKGSKLGSPRLFYVLVVLAFAVLAFNQLQISSLQAASVSLAVPLAAAPAVSQPVGGAATAQASTGQINLEAIAEQVIPKGIPAIYGDELGVSFDDPVNSMTKLSRLDDGKGMKDPALNARYVKIGNMISCEYCCGADALVFKNGDAACGCAHSYAMRGLAKYLLEKHRAEFSDEQIVDELSKWKTLFFPKQILQKAVEFEKAGKPLSINDLASNKYRGFKAPATGSAGAPTGLGALPDMVGGC